MRALALLAIACLGCAMRLGPRDKGLGFTFGQSKITKTTIVGGELSTGVSNMMTGFGYLAARFFGGPQEGQGSPILQAEEPEPELEE